MRTILIYALISVWTVALLGTGYLARDHATRDVQRIEQLPMIGE